MCFIFTIQDRVDQRIYHKKVKMNTERKRKSSEDGKQCKIVKLNQRTLSTGGAAEIKKEINILDLKNHGCLDKVFMHLDLIGLSNVADAHDQFEEVAKYIFEKKFTQSEIWISNHHESVRHKSIKDLDRFGSMVTKLHFNFRLTMFKELCDAVIKNCTDKITELRLTYYISDGHYRVGKNWYNEGNTSQDLVKVFQFFRQLGSQFPRLERLVIHRNGDDFSQGMESWYTRAIPSLKHFEFDDGHGNARWTHTISEGSSFDDLGDFDEDDMDDSDVYYDNDSDESHDEDHPVDEDRPVDEDASFDIRFNYQMLKKFIRLNPQLTSLSLPMDQIPNDFISFLDASVPQLRCLKFTSDFFEGFKRSFTPNGADLLPDLKILKFQVNSSEKIAQFAFLNVDYVKVSQVSAKGFYATKLVNVISHFLQLKKIKLIVPGRLYYGGDEDVYDRDISMDGLQNLPLRCKQLTQIALKFEVGREMHQYIRELSVFEGWMTTVDKEKGTITFDKA